MKSRIIFPVFLILFCSQFFYSTTCYSATAFKCIKNGHTVFSDKPCKGVKNEKVYINDSFTEGESLRPDELKMLKEIEEKEKQADEESIQEAAPEELPGNKTVQNKTKPVINKKECKKATDDLKHWQKIMSLGYPSEESKNYMQTYKEKSDAQKKSCGLVE